MVFSECTHQLALDPVELQGLPVSAQRFFLLLLSLISPAVSNVDQTPFIVADHWHGGKVDWYLFESRPSNPAQALERKKAAINRRGRGSLDRVTSTAVCFLNQYEGNELVGLSELDAVDLFYAVVQSGDCFQIHVRYDTENLKDTQARWIQESVPQTIRAAADILLNQTSTIRILDEASRTSRMPARQRIQVVQRIQCIHEMIEEQAQRTPQREAICSSTGSVTYQVLEHRARSFAATLNTTGVAPGERVMVLCDKTADAACTMLAFFKVGAVCAWANSSFPQERLRYMAGQAGCSRVLVTSDLQERGEQLGLPVIVVPTSWDDGGTTDVALGQTCSPSDEAVIVFTSGSTGVPKAVVHSHGAMCTAAIAMGTDLNLGSHSRVFQFASWGWIVALQDIFATLGAGGTLCLPRADHVQNDLVSSIRSLKANTLTIPPSLLNALTTSDLDGIHTLTFVGEPTSSSAISKWNQGRNVFVNYGTTEVSSPVVSSVCAVDGALHIVQTSSSTRAWLVDPDDHDVLLDQPGSIGELVVESNTVYLGYIDGQSITRGNIVQPIWRKKFPSLERYPTDLIATGDLFQFDDQFRLKNIGRRDGQMKIRGQKVDPSEIEHQVMKYSSDVAELACVKSTFSDSSKEMLVVCLSFKPDASESKYDWISDLDQKLIQDLPMYMIPHGFVELERLPRTATSKVDRRTLAQSLKTMSVEIMRTYNDEESQDDNDTNEWCPKSKELKELWQEVLQPKGNVSLRSNFFRLGGNSLDAMKLVRMLRAKGLLITVADVFRHPTLSGMASVMNTGKGSASELPEVPQPLELVLEESRKTIIQIAVEQCAIKAEDITDIYPSTPMQTSLLVATARDVHAYRAHHKFLLPALWEISRTENAWEKVIQNNELLRSRAIQLDSGDCYQVIGKTGAVSTATDSRMTESPFGAPLFSYRFESTDDHKLYMHWDVHHAVYDGWSTQLILQSLWNSYNDQTGPEVGSFASVAQYVQNASWDTSATFWKGLLSDYSMQTFPRPSQSAAARPTLRLESSSPWRPLRSGITAATMIKAAWAYVLSSYCDTSDIAFSAVVTGRNASILNVEQIVGPLIATVPVRVQLGRDATVKDLLSQIQDLATQTIPHEQFGLGRIAKLGGGAAEAAKARSLVIVQPEEAPVGDDTSRIEEIKEGFDDYLNYPLTLESTLGVDSVRHSLEVDETSLSRFEAEGVLAHFAHVFEYLQQHAAQTAPVSRLSLLSTRDVSLLRKWNPESIPIPNECVHQTIIQRAQDCLEAPAVCSWDGDLTYKQLMSLTAALASKLILRQLGPESVICIAHEKSMWTVVALLAVLRAGAAFLLIDPKLPPGRVEYMIELSGSKLAICSPAQATKMTAFIPEVLCLDETLKNKLRTFDDACLLEEPKPSGSDPAYVIFTSGSTGRPKGIVLEHSQVSSSFEAQVAAGMFHKGWRMLQFAAYNFDPCIADVFGPLLVGGCMCIPREEDRLTRLAAVVNELKIDYIDMTPSAAALMKPEDVPNLKALRFGGELVTAAMVEKWWSSVFLENSYGPSECVITATLTPQVTPSANPAVFGRPVGCSMWIVDPSNRAKLAPIGAVGELAIQGPNVGRGYIKNPEATAKAFLPAAPWQSVHDTPSSSRVYMTGDLVRYNSDGGIEFIGRKDDQVKLRGQRIQLDEIKHAALKVAGVKAVAAILLQLQNGSDKELALVLEFHRSPSALDNNDELRLLNEEELALQTTTLKALEASLKHDLPIYMIPRVWLIVNALPTATSGKFDISRVKSWVASLEIAESWRFSPDHILQQRPTISKIPQSDVVAFTLKRMVNTALGTPQQVSTTEDVEDVAIATLGLDSIRIVSLIRSINSHFGVTLGIDKFLQHGTLTQVAREIDRLKCPTPPPDDLEDVASMIKDMQQLSSEIRCTRKAETASELGSMNVLLTGATGYLGVSILHSLLQQSQISRVSVLVRADSMDKGLQRIISAARTAGWWQESYLPRIEVWLGDLQQPRFALKDVNWARLTNAEKSENAIHAILHNGAVVNWYGSYVGLRQANVMSTFQLLQVVASNSNIRKFAYVSGGSQWDPNEDDRNIPSTEVISIRLRETNGYGQSKLIAEQLVHRAAPLLSDRTMQMATFKPGLILGTEAHGGIANLDDFMWRYVAGCYRIGAYPEEKDSWAFISRGSDISQRIINFLEDDGEYSSNKITNGLPVERFWAAINSALDQPIECVPYETWIKRLVKNINETGQAHPCWSIMHMLESDRSVIGYPITPEVSEEWQRTLPPMEPAVASNVAYLKRVGFLDGSMKADLEAFRRGR